MSEKNKQVKVGDRVRSLVDYWEIRKGDVLKVVGFMAEVKGVYAILGNKTPVCLYWHEFETIDSSTEGTPTVSQLGEMMGMDPIAELEGLTITYDDDGTMTATGCSLHTHPTELGDLSKMMSIDPIKELEGLHTHPTGALRESKEGKGKPHLLLCSFPYALQQLSLHVDCELGRERNFEKGLPLSSFVDAALRHLTLWSCGDEEPHHLRSALWNMAALVETEHRVENGYLSSEIDDIERDKRSEVKYGGES